MPDDPHPRAARATLAAMVACAVAAFGASHAPAARLLLLPVVLALAWTAPFSPAWLRRLLPRVTRLALGATIALGFVITAYPVAAAETLVRLATVAGWSLAALATLSLLTAPRAGLVLPPAIGTLAVASFDPDAAIRGWQIAAAGFALAHAAAVDRTARPGRGVAERRWPVFVAFAMVVLATAAGIVLLLPWAQPRVEQAAADLLITPDRSYSGLSDRSALGDVESLGLSRSLVLRLWSDAPVKLRGRVYTDFDGRTWSSPIVMRPPLPPVSLPTGADRAWLEQESGATYGALVPPGAAVRARVVQVSAPAGLLLAPAQTRVVRLDDSPPSADAFGILRPQGAAVARYATLSDESSAATEDATVARCRLVPVGTSPRILGLAAAIGAGATDAADRIRRTSAWLDHECVYALDVGRFETNDPVSEFLFEKKRGYCEYFATAAALLLRAQGVPTRYVAGFSPSPDQFRAGHFAVREADAHAWIEAWVPGRGWVEVDPTPAADFAAVRAPLGDSAVDGLIAWARAWVAQLRVVVLVRVLAWLRVGGWRVLLFGFVVLGLGRLAWGHRRRLSATVRRRPRAASADHDAPPELARLLARIDRHWRGAGVPRPPHRPPLEHLQQMGSRGGDDATHAAARLVVERYYRARFAAEPVGGAEIAELDRRLTSAGIR